MYNFVEKGNYTIEIESGKFISNLYGQTEQLSLVFSISDAYYDSVYYDSIYYLTD